MSFVGFDFSIVSYLVFLSTAGVGVALNCKEGDCQSDTYYASEYGHLHIFEPVLSLFIIWRGLTSWVCTVFSRLLHVYSQSFNSQKKDEIKNKLAINGSILYYHYYTSFFCHCDMRV